MRHLAHRRTRLGCRSMSGTPDGRATAITARAISAGFVGFAILGAASGCGNPKTTANTSGAAPEAVAVQYVTDISAHKFDDAANLVLSGDRSDFKVVSAVIAKRQTSAHDIKALSTDVTGETATVTVGGTVCSGDGANPSASPSCLTNTDPKSKNPVFRVSLEKAPDGRWYVYFPAPVRTSPQQTATSSPSR